jgi:glycosyltransferase involved in cell wall biosynthesis
MNLLLYYTGNKRSIALETWLREYVRHGHQVHLMTACEPGELHERAAQLGVRVSGFFAPKNKLYYAKQIRHLIAYCWREHIDVVLSQLQEANIIAVFAERMTRARFYMFRHHPQPHSGKEKLVDWIVNRLARHIVVLTGPQKQIVLSEGVPESRIHLVPLMYDFDEYRPSAEVVRSVRERYRCTLLVIMLSRLVHYKRHMLAFQAIEDLVSRGHDVRLIVMDDGPEKSKLEAHVRQRGLEQRITFLGYQSNVTDYLEASDVLLQPSESEVSANAVKEAAVRGKIVVACRGVGDFDDYLEDTMNAVLVNVTDGASTIADRLEDIIKNRPKYDTIGARLRQRVLDKFGCTPTNVDRYLRLLDGRLNASEPRSATEACE